MGRSFFLQEGIGWRLPCSVMSSSNSVETLLNSSATGVRFGEPCWQQLSHGPIREFSNGTPRGPLNFKDPLNFRGLLTFRDPLTLKDPLNLKIPFKEIPSALDAGSLKVPSKGDALLVVSQDHPEEARHILGWLSHLSRLLPAKEGRITAEGLSLYTEFLTRDIPVEAFTIESLHSVLKELRFWSSYAELYTALGRYCEEKSFQFHKGKAGGKGHKRLRQSRYWSGLERARAGKWGHISQAFLCSYPGYVTCPEELWKQVEGWLLWFMAKEEEWEACKFHASDRLEDEEATALPFKREGDNAQKNERLRALKTLHDLCPIAWHIVCQA
ncbi:hypothetical protein JGUZn3_10350 [Entomobacter blattae]|uniref:Uncharacterized protein n=2 Tax=Entomobacter blattae TaxID=2762277 RepID=A0A7H1NR53_9PROT|nr:hypothetical protein JGUZn3_10350 [Entomobacter blattae]